MIYSVRWQLLLSMVAVILITVGMTAFLANRATTAGIERVQDRDEVERTRRLTSLLTRDYVRRRGWTGSQDILELASQLTGERVVVSDRDGQVVADSHHTFIGRRLDSRIPSQAMMVVSSPDGPVGTLMVNPELPRQAGSGVNVEAQPSNPSLNVLLILSGLLAVAVAMILTFFVSRRILSPIESLSKVSRQTARRDFSARAEVKYRDEVGELARTFNSMVEELARTEELRRNLVADVAHELRTPVTNIRGYVEGIADGVIKADDATWGSIHSEILLLTRLIEDLQDLALAESGQMQLHLQPCDMSCLVQGAVASIHPQAQAKQISLTLEDSPGLPIDADPQRIGQVLRNLLVNAVTNTPEDGTIKVHAYGHNGRVHLSVKNSGPGIPAEDLARIFERFYRVDKSRSRATGGVGLGLTITKHLVEAHGGTIEAFSQPDGEIEILITLPRP